MPRKKAGEIPVGQRGWYTPQEAADQLGLSLVQFNRHVRDGKISSITLPLSGNRVFPKAEIAQLRREEMGIPEDDPSGPANWPGDTGLPPGAVVTASLEASRV